MSTELKKLLRQSAKYDGNQLLKLALLDNCLECNKINPDVVVHDQFNMIMHAKCVPKEYYDYVVYVKD